MYTLTKFVKLLKTTQFSFFLIADTNYAMPCAVKKYIKTYGNAEPLSPTLYFAGQDSFEGTTYSLVPIYGRMSGLENVAMAFKDNFFKKAAKNKIDTIFIHDIHLMNAFALDYFDQCFRSVGDETKPFGGFRIIAFGNIFQLEPLTEGFDEVDIAMYETPYFFSAAVFKEPLSLEFFVLGEEDFQRASLCANSIGAIIFNEDIAKNLAVIKRQFTKK